MSPSGPYVVLESEPHVKGRKQATPGSQSHSSLLRWVPDSLETVRENTATSAASLISGKTDKPPETKNGIILNTSRPQGNAVNNSISDP